MKRLREIADSVARFWEPLEPLRRGQRLGPVLWQLPESFHRFRHPSWYAAPVRELLEERGASLAIGDDKRRPLPEARPAGKLAYQRLHYGHRGRGGNYSETELDDWRRRIAAWRSHRPRALGLSAEPAGRGLDVGLPTRSEVTARGARRHTTSENG